MKLSPAKYRKNYQAYILDHVEFDYNGNPLETDKAKIKFLFDRFYGEYGWFVEQRGKRQAMIDWLSGLALPIACYNGEIVDLAISMGSIDDNPSEKLIDKILQNYFPFMAAMVLDLERQAQ